MPHRHYQHVCGTRGVRDLSWTPCPSCGAPGVFVDWQWSGIEHMGKFRRLYGLPPIGLHRRLLEGLQIRESCQTCEGRGLFDVESGTNYRVCGVCDGIGARLTCSSEELEALQQISWSMIRHGKSSSGAGGSTPVERFFAKIADEPLRTAAARFLEQGRLGDLHRVLVWQGMVTEEDEDAQRAYNEPQEEEEIEPDDIDEAELPPAPRSLADLLDMLDDLKRRDQIAD